MRIRLRFTRARSFATVTLAELKNRVPASMHSFVSSHVDLLRPSSIFLCDGSAAEQQSLCKLMVQQGTLTPLNPELRPNSYLARSDPLDVARVEDRTFICTENAADAGPTNYWRHPKEILPKLNNLMNGSMSGRTMYVVPFSMANPSSPFAMLGVQLTDSPYVAASMRTMTHMGDAALKQIAATGDFVRCVHALGAPDSTSSWPCDRDGIKFIAHFPYFDAKKMLGASKSKEVAQTGDSTHHLVVSYGSGYGGNALLGKKCLSLRLASAIGKREGWLAEHMLILGITNPQGEKRYVAAAFPSACGKTNLAMLRPSLEAAPAGWKFETIGDDIAWLRVRNGRLYAVNPENGFFGVAPGTSYATNPSAMATIAHDTIFTNCGLTPDGDVYWHGMNDGGNGERKAKVQSFVEKGEIISWKGNKGCSSKEASHPNARFTVAAEQCPAFESIDQSVGVPIDAILFGGRRSSTIPLVMEATSHAHGVLMGATMRSETTAAAAGQTGVLRNDPFAMLPFCGYSMGSYFGHWIDTVSRLDKNAVKFYGVNWFRRNSHGEFVWPGFGDNARVLRWVFDRCAGRAGAKEDLLGLVPGKEMDTTGLNVDLEQVFYVGRNEVVQEMADARKYLNSLGGEKAVPKRLYEEIDRIEKNALATAKLQQVA